MTIDEISRSSSEDLRIEYFNLREYLKFEYTRALLPTIMFIVVIALVSLFPKGDDEVSRSIAVYWPYLTTLTAFFCAFGIVYFGGRAWRSTKMLLEIHRELQKRTGL